MFFWGMFDKCDVFMYNYVDRVSDLLAEIKWKHTGKLKRVRLIAHHFSNCYQNISQAQQLRLLKVHQLEIM